MWKEASYVSSGEIREFILSNSIELNLRKRDLVDLECREVVVKYGSFQIEEFY